MLRWFYKVHKWVGVGIGLVLLMWIVTGMLLGGGEGRPREAGPPDFSRAVVAPAAAAALAQAGDSALATVRGVELAQLGGALFYRVRGEGGTVLVNAERPERFIVSDSLARGVAQAMFPEGSVQGVELLRRHDAAYPAGALPAWRVSFGDRRGTQVHVALRDGQLSVSNGDLRLNRTLHDLHTFAAFRVTGLGRVPTRRLLTAASAIALVVVLTGYYMSLPRAWTRR